MRFLLFLAFAHGALAVVASTATVAVTGTLAGIGCATFIVFVIVFMAKAIRWTDLNADPVRCCKGCQGFGECLLGRNACGCIILGTTGALCVVIAGVVPLTLGIIDYIKLDGITARTTCTVKSNHILTQTCTESCGRGCTRNYPCYRGFIKTDCCGFCPVCQPDQTSEIGTSTDYSQMAQTLGASWYPGKQFECVNRLSDGTIALYQEWEAAVGELVAGLVLVILAHLYFVWIGILYCRSHNRSCFHYDQHDIEVKVRNLPLTSCFPFSFSNNSSSTSRRLICIIPRVNLLL